jgi:CDP-diglyceride synthetase
VAKVRLQTWDLGLRTKEAVRAERPGILTQRVVFGFAVGGPVLLGAYLGGPWFLLGASLIGFLGLRELFALTARPGVLILPALGYALGFGLLLANGGLELLWQGFGPPLGLSRPDPAATVLLTRFAVAGTVALPLVGLLFVRREPEGAAPLGEAPGSPDAAGPGPTVLGPAGAPPPAPSPATPAAPVYTVEQGRLIGWALTVAGTFYVAWLLGLFQALRLVGGGDGSGRGWVLYVLAATWAYDTGAYLVGRRFGRHRFMTWISPSKTWEGAAGGLLFCLVATLIARSPLAPPLAALSGWAPLPVPLWHVPFLALAVCLAAQIGDLAESMIKRGAGAKDASALIPGHGGMLDRMDSLLFTVVLVYAYVALVLGLR